MFIELTNIRTGLPVLINFDNVASVEFAEQSVDYPQRSLIYFNNSAEVCVVSESFATVKRLIGI